MPLRVLLVDDERLCLDGLRAALGAYPYVRITGTARSGGEALELLRGGDVDLVFLDIEMGDVSGFELARHMQDAYPRVMLVFLTGHVDLALDGYEFMPLDFLSKPVNPLRLERTLLRARERLEAVPSAPELPARIGLPVCGGLEIIDVDSFLYVEKEGRRVFLVCKNGERYRTYDTLQKLAGILEPYGVFRCHQSFLVRLSAIKSIHLDLTKNSYGIRLSGTDACIPLSRSNYPALREVLRQKGMKIYA